MSVPATSAEAPAAHPARNPWAVLAVLCLGLFMILLDGTIVNIAIPRIMTSFGTGLSNVEWVMNAYVLAFAVLLVTLGRFGDLYGRRRLLSPAWRSSRWPRWPAAWRRASIGSSPSAWYRAPAAPR